MAVTGSLSPLFGETICGSLLQKLQVGESDEERDRMLLQLEQDCLDVYKRKVDQPTKSRALLLQELADSKYELTRPLSALGEKTYIGIEQLAAIAPALEQLYKQKEERIKEFTDVQSQIQKICSKIAGSWNISEKVRTRTVDENDLSLKNLDEFHTELQELQTEKDVVPKYPTKCDVEWVYAEDPLFLLYISGSTGKPKGVLHTSGGYMVYAATTFKYAFDYKPSDIYIGVMQTAVGLLDTAMLHMVLF